MIEYSPLIKRVCYILELLVLALVIPVIARGQTITGKVTDAKTNQALAGANIVVKGTDTGTFSDAKGNYSLNVPSLSDTLSISFVGYKIKEIPINGKTSINIVLTPTRLSGKSIVVIGYGTKQKQNVTGAVSSISSEDIESASVSTLDQTLSGKISGVDVHTNSHSPGGSISVHIRGTTSLSASSQPLYIVDGFPIQNDAVIDVATNKQAPPRPQPAKYNRSFEYCIHTSFKRAFGHRHLWLPRFEWGGDH